MIMVLILLNVVTVILAIRMIGKKDEQIADIENTLDFTTYTLKESEEKHRKLIEGSVKLVIENIELQETINMLAEAEVAALYPEEVNG